MYFTLTKANNFRNYQTGMIYSVNRPLYLTQSWHKVDQLLVLYLTRCRPMCVSSELRSLLLGIYSKPMVDLTV